MPKLQTLEANINKMDVNIDEWIKQPIEHIPIVEKNVEKPSTANIQLDKKTSQMINKFVKEDIQHQNERFEQNLGIQKPKNTENAPKTTSVVSKQQKIWKIEKYIHSIRFGDFIQNDLKIDYTREELDVMESRELDKILERIRIQLDNKNLDAFYNGLARTSSILAEKGLSNVYNIDGFTDNLFQNDAFLDGLERYKIDHGPLSYVPPSIQISYAIVSTAYITHTLNSQKLGKPPKKYEMKPPSEEAMKLLEEDVKPGQSL